MVGSIHNRIAAFEHLAETSKTISSIMPIGPKSTKGFSAVNAKEPMIRGKETYAAAPFDSLLMFDDNTDAQKKMQSTIALQQTEDENQQILRETDDKNNQQIMQEEMSPKNNNQMHQKNLGMGDLAMGGIQKENEVTDALLNEDNNTMNKSFQQVLEEEEEKLNLDDGPVTVITVSSKSTSNDKDFKDFSQNETQNDKDDDRRDDLSISPLSFLGYKIDARREENESATNNQFMPTIDTIQESIELDEPTPTFDERQQHAGMEAMPPPAGEEFGRDGAEISDLHSAINPSPRLNSPIMNPAKELEDFFSFELDDEITGSSDQVQQLPEYQQTYNLPQHSESKLSMMNNEPSDDKYEAPNNNDDDDSLAEYFGNLVTDSSVPADLDQKEENVNLDGKDATQATHEQFKSPKDNGDDITNGEDFRDISNEEILNLDIDSIPNPHLEKSKLDRTPSAELLESKFDDLWSEHESFKAKPSDEDGDAPLYAETQESGRVFTTSDATLNINTGNESNEKQTEIDMADNLKSLLPLEWSGKPPEEDGNTSPYAETQEPGRVVATSDATFEVDTGNGSNRKLTEIDMADNVMSLLPSEWSGNASSNDMYALYGFQERESEATAEIQSSMAALATEPYEIEGITAVDQVVNQTEDQIMNPGNNEREMIISNIPSTIQGMDQSEHIFTDNQPMGEMEHNINSGPQESMLVLNGSGEDQLGSVVTNSLNDLALGVEYDPKEYQRAEVTVESMNPMNMIGDNNSPYNMYSSNESEEQVKASATLSFDSHEDPQQINMANYVQDTDEISDTSPFAAINDDDEDSLLELEEAHFINNSKNSDNLIYPDMVQQDEQPFSYLDSPPQEHILINEHTRPIVNNLAENSFDQKHDGFGFDGRDHQKVQRIPATKSEERTEDHTGTVLPHQNGHPLELSPPRHYHPSSSSGPPLTFKNNTFNQYDDSVSLGMSVLTEDSNQRGQFPDEASMTYSVSEQTTSTSISQGGQKPKKRPTSDSLDPSKPVPIFRTASALRDNPVLHNAQSTISELTTLDSASLPGAARRPSINNQYLSTIQGASSDNKSETKERLRGASPFGRRRDSSVDSAVSKSGFSRYSVANSQKIPNVDNQKKEKKRRGFSLRSLSPWRNRRKKDKDKDNVTGFSNYGQNSTRGRSKSKAPLQKTPSQMLIDEERAETFIPLVAVSPSQDSSQSRKAAKGFSFRSLSPFTRRKKKREPSKKGTRSDPFDEGVSL